MSDKQFLEIIEAACERHAGTISMESLVSEIGMDSIALISLLAQLDGLLGRSVSADEISKAETVREIFEIVLI